MNATGITWRQYLQESRLLKAMALLAEGDQSTLTIAMSVGVLVAETAATN